MNRPTGPGTGPTGGPTSGRSPVKNPFSPTAAAAQEEEVFEEDFTDVAPGFSLLSAGFHYFMVKDMEKSVSNAGKDQFVWDFVVVTPGTPDLGSDFRQWTSLVPNARFKVVEFLEAMGIESQGKMARFRRSDVLGKAVMGEVTHGSYFDKNNVERTSASVVKLLAPDEGCIAAVEAYKKAVATTPG